MSTLPVRRPVFLVLVCHSYPPVIGGSEIEAQRVCAGLIAGGHKVEVLCAGGPPMPAKKRWLDPMGVPARMFGRPGRLGTYAYVCGVLKTLWTERRRYELVYFLMPGLQVLAGVALARALRKPVLMKFSGSNEIRKLTQSRVGRLELACLRRWAARILVLNPGMFTEAAETGFAESQVGWMPNPVDINEFTPASREERRALRDRFNLPQEAFVLIYVGRLAPEKELPTLLRGYSKAARKYPAAHLVLVGGGEEQGRLEELARSLDGGSRIRFAGMVAPSEVRHWLQAADSFALVSRFEGFPVSLIEAMSVELPAVVSAIPGNLQLITHEVNGLVAPVGDEDAVAGEIAKLIENPEFAAKIAKAGREQVVAQYSTAAVIAMYEKTFEEVVGNPST